MDSHDSTKHYVNGPEAFLTTLLAEFKDAQKRFEELYNRISKLVTPPVSIRNFRITHMTDFAGGLHVQRQATRQTPLRG